MELDKGRGTDQAAVGARIGVKEIGNWVPHWRLEKRDGDVDEFIAEQAHEGVGEAEARARFHQEVEPCEVVEWDHNGLANAGINVMLDLLMGGAGTVYSNANAYLGAGDSNAAFDATQTDLQAAVNKVRVAVNAGFPSVSAQTITFEADFGGASGNFAWEEVGTFNDAAAGEMLNRSVSSLGTKAAGATWTLSLAITIS